MKSIIKIISIVSASFLLIACGGFGDDDFDSNVNDVTFSAGSLNITKYVAIGDSLTAGFADGALYKSAQESSFPNILSQSFARVGGGTFTQPLSDNLGGLLLSGAALTGFDVRLVLAPDSEGDLKPVSQSVVTPSVMSTNEIGVALAGPFDNLGVPGAKSFHLTLDNYGDVTRLAAEAANPYFVRFRSAAATNIVADAVSQAPTFFTLWIGNNDILDYGRNGGTGNDSSTVPAYGMDSNDITNPAVFAAVYQSVISALTTSGGDNIQGALINIPAITSIPFFTTVPFNAIPLDQASADAANLAFAAYNAGVASQIAIIGQAEVDQRTINYVAGQNAVLITDESLTDLTAGGLPNIRQATAEDFILLTTSSLLGTPRDALVDATPSFVGQAVGVGAPLVDAEVLTKTEAAEIEAARLAYNTTILATANANPNLVYIDTAAALADAADSDGLNYGTGVVTSIFATGGVFSLDGIHPTAKGYAIVSNLIVDALNTGFNANLPKVDPNEFSETFFAFPEGFDFSQ